MWMYYASAGVIASFILVGMILLIVNRAKKKAFNTVNLKISMDKGEVRAYGVRKEYLITVQEKYQYLVREGEIVAVKDLKQPDVFKEYIGGSQSC